MQADDTAVHKHANLLSQHIACNQKNKQLVQSQQHPEETTMEYTFGSFT